MCSANRLAPALALALCLLVEAGFAQGLLQGTDEAGRKLFYSAAISTNGLSCAHCHSDFDERTKSDGLIRAAHSLANSYTRTSWWGRDPQGPDAFQDVAEAATVCIEIFQRNPRKLTAQQGLDLLAYLKHITRRSERAPQPIAPAVDRTGQYLGFGGGDKVKGRELFFAACHSCHPGGNVGIGPALPRDRDPSFYAKEIREGNGLGAVLAGVDPNAYDPKQGLFMPFFGADRLTDQEIRDLIAYLKSLPPPPP